MEGERIDSVLNVRGENEGGKVSDLVLLTDRRVIHVQGNSRDRRAVFASVEDIEAVEIGSEREGGSGFIWAGLALLAAVLLYFVIDHSVGRIAGAAAVASLGVYLAAEQILTPRRSTALFKAGSSEIRCDLKGDLAKTEVYAFVNRLFQLKSGVSVDLTSRPDGFAPR